METLQTGFSAVLGHRNLRRMAQFISRGVSRHLSLRATIGSQTFLFFPPKSDLFRVLDYDLKSANTAYRRQLAVLALGRSFEQAFEPLSIQMPSQSIAFHSFPEFTGMLLSVGARHGAGVVNGWHFPSFMVGLVKGRTLFSSKYWGTMRQKVPSK